MFFSSVTVSLVALPSCDIKHHAANRKHRADHQECVILRVLPATLVEILLVWDGPQRVPGAVRPKKGKEGPRCEKRLEAGVREEKGLGFPRIQGPVESEGLDGEGAQAEWARDRTLRVGQRQTPPLQAVKVHAGKKGWNIERGAVIRRERPLREHKVHEASRLHQLRCFLAFQQELILKLQREQLHVRRREGEDVARRDE